MLKRKHLVILSNGNGTKGGRILPTPRIAPNYTLPGSHLLLGREGEDKRMALLLCRLPICTYAHIHMQSTSENRYLTMYDDETD